MKKESTPLADIMIEYGESIGEERGFKKGEVTGIEKGKAEGINIGKAEMLQDIQKAYQEAIKRDPTITFPEFMENFLKSQKED